MNNPIHIWRAWRLSDALDRGIDPRRAGVFEDASHGLGRFQAGLRELDRRLSDPARTPIMEAPKGLSDRVMHAVVGRARAQRSRGEDRGLTIGSWQRLIGLALAAGLAIAAISWPDRGSPSSEEPAVASLAKAPSPELALAGTGQAVVRLMLGGPSAVVPTPIEPKVLEGTRQMGVRAMAALERFGQDRADALRGPRDSKSKPESGSGKSNRRPGEPEMRTNDALPGVLLAMQVVSRLT